MQYDFILSVSICLVLLSTFCRASAVVFSGSLVELGVTEKKIIQGEVLIGKNKLYGKVHLLVSGIAFTVRLFKCIISNRTTH